MIAGASISASPIASAPNDRKEPSIGFAATIKNAYGVEGFASGLVAVDLGQSNSTKRAFGLLPLSLPGLGASASQKRTYGLEWIVSGLATPNLGSALSEHRTFGWIANYLIEGVPVMTASRVGTTVTIDIDNLSNTPVSIWKTTGHRENFTLVGNYAPSEFPIQITGQIGNPKFKAAFSVVAIRNGVETASSGQRGRSKFTIET